VTTAEWLDALDQAHAAATSGPWSNPEYTSSVYGGDDLVQLLRVASSVHSADATAIVAEHNATPLLVAALRAVLDAADDWDGQAKREGDDGAIHARHAYRLRAAVSSALGVETTP
jgi:hypothetical protein